MQKPLPTLLPSARLLLTGSLLEDFQTGIALEPLSERTHTFILETVLLQAAEREDGGAVTFLTEDEVPPFGKLNARKSTYR